MRVAISSGNCIECPQSLVQSYPARGAFTARLGMSEFDKVAGDIYHAVVFVHHHHATRAHDRADLRQALIVHLRIKHFYRNTSARGTAGLHGFHSTTVDGTFTDVVDELLERSTKRHLDQARILYLSYQI